MIFVGKEKIKYLQLLPRESMSQNFVSCQSNEAIFYENKLVTVYLVQEYYVCSSGRKKKKKEWSQERLQALC